MKKFFAPVLLILAGVLWVMPRPVATAQAPDHPATAQTDGFGNPVSEDNRRYNYRQNPAGGFTRLELDAQDEVIDQQALSVDPFAGQFIRTTEPVEELSLPETTSTGLAVEEEWRFTLYGAGLGVSGLVIYDLDNDGVMEVLLGASAGNSFDYNNYWHVLRASGPNQYARIWSSDQYNAAIYCIAVDDVNGDGIAEIVLALSDGTMRVHRGTDYQEIGAFTHGLQVKSLLLADANGDGVKEIVFSDGTRIAAYHAASYQLLWQTTAYGGDLAVGNVDTDPSPEIVSSAGYVLHGPTRAVEWTNPISTGFGIQIAVGDIDGDGIAEILGTADWRIITVFEADIQSPMWEIYTSHDIGALTLIDVDGDSHLEILYGDGQWGSIHCVDGQTRQEVWTVKNPEHGVTRIAAGDPDGDQALEVIWGAGYTTTGPDFLYIADIASTAIEWQTDDLDGPLSAVDLGDVDDDGEAEIFMASLASGSGIHDSVLSIFNAETHALEWQIEDVPNIDPILGTRSVRMGDVDQDGQTEFVIATADIYDGLIQIYDGRTHALERQSTFFVGTTLTAMEIGDVDGDGQVEIVVGESREHTGADAVNVSVFNGATAALEWQSIGLNNYWGIVYDLHLANIDSDPHIEIIVAMYGDRVYVFDGVTHVMEAMIPNQALAISSTDFDQNGTQSILVGRSDGKIDLYNGKTYQHEGTITVSDYPITCLSLADLDLDGMEEWLTCTANRLLAFASADGRLLWQSQNLGPYLGYYNQVPVSQIDGDINQEIVIGAANSLHQFQSDWVGPLGLSTMTVAPKSAKAGETLTYSIQVHNQGPEALSHVQLSNLLPAGLSYRPDTLTASSGSAVFTNGVIQWTGALAEQSTATITYQTSANPDAPLGKLVNSAHITAGAASKMVSATTTIQFPFSVYLPVCASGWAALPCGDYFDDFENASSGWPVGEDEWMKAGYVNGEYQILANQPAYLYLIKAPTCARQNYMVEVDARWAGNSGSYGLLFGLAEDFSRYYMFLVNTDWQDYALYYFESGSFTPIVEETVTSAIHGQFSKNHLKVTRNGSQISLEINGVILGTWTDANSTGPAYVGLVNAPYVDLAFADARFDNFMVTALSELPAGQPMGAFGLRSMLDRQSIESPIEIGRSKPEN